MSTYKQLLYQIVFTTHNCQLVLQKEQRPELFKYIWGILKNKRCHLYRINGMEDHIHIVLHIHPTIAISDLIKDIKLASNKMIKEKELFEKFQGWQEGYGVFSYSYSAKKNLIEYVKNQEEHHKKVSFKEEYIILLKENGLEFDPDYLI